MENNHNNRNQFRQQEWKQGDQDFDRYRENQNRYERFSNDNGGNQGFRNQRWQNSDDRNSNSDRYMNSGNENRGEYFEEQNHRGQRPAYDQNRREDYQGNDWNQQNENRNLKQNYEQGNYRSDYKNNSGRNNRNWWDRTSDEVSSWFGDDDAEHRRRMDKMNGPHKGKGPKGYSRSDERITEEINEELYHDFYVDASEIEVKVTGGEVVLTGNIDSRDAKRRAEDLAESVSGVKNVLNQLKVNNATNSSFNMPGNQANDLQNGRKKNSLVS